MLADRKLFMTLAHDEYWTVDERAALDSARDQGLSLGFFSANTGYWRVRLGPSTRGIPRRTLTCYKSASEDPVKNAPDTTVMFSDEPFSHPENALVGAAYRTWSKVPGYPYIVTNADHWLYAGTAVHTFDALSNVVGAEWDGVVDNGKSPDGLEVLARAVTIDNVATAQRSVSGVAVGTDGAVYFTTIAKGQIGVVRNGKVTILANVPGLAGNREGPAEQAQLQPQEGMLVDGDRLLFTDTENRGCTRYHELGGGQYVACRRQRSGLRRRAWS